MNNIEFPRSKLSWTIGNFLYNITIKVIYAISYPIFSIVRAAWKALKEAWEDAA